MLMTEPTNWHELDLRVEINTCLEALKKSLELKISVQSEASQCSAVHEVRLIAFQFACCSLKKNARPNELKILAL